MRGFKALEQIFPGLETDVLNAAMGVGEHVVNLVEHERDIRDVGDFDVQHVDVFIDAEQRLQGGERNEDR